MSTYANADCHYGDHHWEDGGSVCGWCGTRLRCFCGQFLREDSIETHIGTEEKPGPCPMVAAHKDTNHA